MTTQALQVYPKEVLYIVILYLIICYNVNLVHWETVIALCGQRDVYEATAVHK